MVSLVSVCLLWGVGLPRARRDMMQALVCYVRGAFCPSPDQTVGQLFSCFELDKELVVNYSLTNAWG